MKEMIYLISQPSNKVVARYYCVSNGYIFDEGSRFEDKDPVSGLNVFFAIQHTVCDSKRELNYCINKLKKKYNNIIEEKKYYR